MMRVVKLRPDDNDKNELGDLESDSRGKEGETDGRVNAFDLSPPLRSPMKSLS